MPVGDRCDDQSFGLAGGQVFHGMHSEVYFAAQECVFYFFGEKAFAFELVKAQVLDQIALRFDNDQFALQSDLFKRCLGEFRLPKGKPAAACTYFQHGRKGRNYPLIFFLESDGAAKFPGRGFRLKRCYFSGACLIFFAKIAEYFVNIGDICLLSAL